MIIKQNLCFGQEVCSIPDFRILSCEGCPSYKPGEEREPDTYRHYPHQHRYTKKQAGRLFLKTEELEGRVNSLTSKVKNIMLESASKRKTIDTNKLINLYKGTGSRSENTK